MGLTFSDLGRDKIDAALALWEICDLTRPWNDARADAERALDMPTSAILAAWDDGQLVGTVVVGDDGHRGWVYYLAVKPDARRTGLGRKLMGAAEQWLDERGAPKIQLMVRTDNEQALGFYDALGYDVQPVTTIGKRLAVANPSNGNPKIDPRFSVSEE